MPSYKIYQVDAFASEIFKGNPAAVIPLDDWLSDSLMQTIAVENNLSETAYYKPNKEGKGFDLRWFTPGFEVDLCGHATLATAHVLFEHEHFRGNDIRFQTRVGELSVKKTETGYLMDFPIDELIEHPVPEWAVEAMGANISAAFEGREDWLFILENQAVIEGLQPNQNLLMRPEARGVIATAPGDEVDFVSRCFFPKHGIPEDPVTGSAHTTMAAFWAPKFGKTIMTAKQLSPRGGDVGIEVKGDRVLLTGKAQTFMKGKVFF